MSIAVAASGPTAMWYLTRGSGAVALVLLTASAVLGTLDVRRWRAEGWPRFVVAAIHRNVSLYVVIFVVIHVVTSVLDGFAPIALTQAVIPGRRSIFSSAIFSSVTLMRNICFARSS